MLFDLATGIATGALSVIASVIIKPLEAIVGIFTEKHKYVRLMRVEGLSLLLNNNIPRCDSSTILDSGHKWKMVFFPKGTKMPNSISLFVELEDAASLRGSLTLDLQVFIICQKTGNYRSMQWRGLSYSSSKTMHGVDSWISRDLLSRVGNYIVDDSIVLGFEITNLRWNYYDNDRPVARAERLTLINKPLNSKFTWKITKFSSFKKDTHNSDTFVIGQRKWSILMYPKGVLDGEGNWLSLFLTASGYTDNAPRGESTVAKYNLRVLNQLGGAHFEASHVAVFDGSGLGYGGTQFMPLKDLYDKSKGFLVNDVIYIGVDFQVISVSKHVDTY